MLVGKALSFTHVLSFFSLFINPPRSAAAQWKVDGHQMYFGGSVVGKASTISRELSPTPPPRGKGPAWPQVALRSQLPHFLVVSCIIFMSTVRLPDVFCLVNKDFQKYCCHKLSAKNMKYLGPANYYRYGSGD